MKYALVDSNGTVVNIIEYDGVSPYQAPDGLTVQSVNDWCIIGQSENITQQEATDIMVARGQP